MALTNPQGKLVLTEGSSNYSFTVAGTTLNTTGVSTNTITTANLISWWRFEENNNTSNGILDSAYTTFGVGANPGNHGTKFGTSSFTTGPTNGGNGLTFSGDDYITFPDCADLTELTWDVWVKNVNAAGSTNESIIFNGGWVHATSGASIAYNRTGNLFYAAIGNGVSMGYRTFSVSTTAWTQIAMTYKGSNTAGQRISVYVNGSFIGNENTGTVPTSRNHNGNNIFGAEDTFAPAQFLSGSGGAFVDEVKYYNRELTAAEILQNYNYYQ